MNDYLLVQNVHGDSSGKAIWQHTCIHIAKKLTFAMCVAL